MSKNRNWATVPKASIRESRLQSSVWKKAGVNFQFAHGLKHVRLHWWKRMVPRQRSEFRHGFLLSTTDGGNMSTSWTIGVMKKRRFSFEDYQLWKWKRDARVSTPCGSLTEILKRDETFRWRCVRIIGKHVNVRDTLTAALKLLLSSLAKEESRPWDRWRFR